jgi:hypothetical protein
MRVALDTNRYTDLCRGAQSVVDAMNSPSSRSVCGGAASAAGAYTPAFFSIFAQESLSGSVRLKTRLPAVESGSTQK